MFSTRVIMAIIFSAMSVGQASSFAPDYGKAKISAGKILALFDRTPAIDNSNTEGEKPVRILSRKQVWNEPIF